MESVADFKEKYQLRSWERLKAAIRTRISILIGLAAFVGWVLSRITSKKRRTYVPGSIQGADHHSGEIKLAGKPKQLKDSGGLLSLVLELLGAIAIRLLQRYLKFWRSTLIVKLQNPPESSAGLPRGSGANCFKCMFLSGEKTLQILSGQDSGPNVGSGACFSG